MAKRADNVWDVAVLHGTIGIAAFKSPETAAGANGIGADVTGLGLEQFDPQLIGRIMATRPGFARPVHRRDRHRPGGQAPGRQLHLVAQYGQCYFGTIKGMDGKTNSPKPVSGIETPDDSTIVFHPTKPTGDFLYRLSMPAT